MTYTVTFKINGVVQVTPELTLDEAFIFANIKLNSFVRYYNVECDTKSLMETLYKKEEIKIRDNDSHDLIIYFDRI